MHHVIPISRCRIVLPPDRPCAVCGTPTIGVRKKKPACSRECCLVLRQREKAARALRRHH
jgi:hypothetical protein